MVRSILAPLFLLLVLASPARAFELVFWTTEIHDDRLVVIDFLAKAYGVMQDDVTVKVVSVNENELVERLHVAAKTGETPHLVGTGSELLIALSETGCLDTVAASRIVHRMGVDRFYPGALNMLAAPGGKTWYGVPFHGWVQGIWYRADWFEEAGLAPPRNWLDIFRAAKRFTDADKGRYGILVGTAEDHYAAQVFTQIALSVGATMFSGDGKVVFDSPAMVRALEFYAELARCAPPGRQTWRARDYFLQGRLAMMFYSTFIMDDLAMEKVAANSLTGDNFSELSGADFDRNLVNNVRMVPVIVNAKSAGYGMINGFGLCKRASRKEQEAVEGFLEFLYEPAQYVTWLHMAPGGMLPVLRSVAESDSFLADPSELFRRYGREKITEVIDGLEYVRSFGVVEGKRFPAASLVYAEGVIPRMITRTVFDGVPAAQSVKTADAEIRAIVRSMNAQ